MLFRSEGTEEESAEDTEEDIEEDTEEEIEDDTITEIMLKIELIQEDIEKLGEDIDTIPKKMDDKYTMLIGASKIILEKINAAINQINNLEKSKKEAIKEVNSYESYLDGKKSDLDVEAYTSIVEDFNETKEYIQQIDSTDGDISMVGQVLAMRGQLECNKQILEQLITLGSPIDIGYTGNVNEGLEIANTTKEAFADYKISNLKFSYDTFEISENSHKDIFSSFHSLISDGILG